MASKKEQLRAEREQRDAEQRSAQRRRRLVGYAAGATIVLVAIAAAVGLLAGGGSDGGDATADVLPDGGSYPEPRDGTALAAAARAAGCELESYRVKGRSPHTTDLGETVDYPTTPPAGGRHYTEWADDRAYEDPPDVKMLVHTMEHGRVIVWFEKRLPADQRAALKAYYDDDPYQMVLVPDETGMTYDVAATAWNRDPRPDGTGRLLGCGDYNDQIFTALETFKDENRGIGPEPVP